MQLYSLATLILECSHYSKPVCIISVCVMYVCMPMPVCVHLCMCISMYPCIPACLYVLVCVCVLVLTYMCVVHVCTSACVFLLIIRFGILSLRLISPTSIIFSASFYVFQFHVSQSARYLEKISGLILLEVTVYREGHIKSVTEK